jgi:hypothetical protein
VRLQNQSELDLGANYRCEGRPLRSGWKKQEKTHSKRLTTRLIFDIIIHILFHPALGYKTA